MFMYRGRKLNISDEFIKQFEKVMLVPLNQSEIDSYVHRALGVSPDDKAVFESLSDKDIENAVLTWAREEMYLMS